MATNNEFKFPDEQEQETKVSVEAEGGVEIEIVDDTPERDRGRKPLEREVDDPTEDEIESYSEGVKKRIKELTHARHDERRNKEAIQREKQELERLAQQLLQENNNLKQRYNQGQEIFVHTAKEKGEADLEMARRKLKEAHEAFDTDAIVAAQEQLAEAKMRVENLRNYRPAPLQTQEVPVQIQQNQETRVQPDEKTLRWQAKNQWFGQEGFEEYTSYALGLHQKLVTGGIDSRSDEYFDQINGRMRSKFPELFGNEDAKADEVRRKPTTVVAPASRSTSAGKVRLTQTQVALAKKFGLTPQQYAAQVAKLENQNG